MAELSDTIKQAAADPKSAAADGVSTTAHSLRDMIEADKYLDAKNAAKATKLPVRVSRVRSGPPGGGAR
jgi:hypothetical protein